MKIDVHCHMVGNGRNLDNALDDVYFYPDDNQHWFTRMLANMLEEDLKRNSADLDRDGVISTQEYGQHIYRMLASSTEIDGLVLLAMDAVYSPRNGTLDAERTDLWVTNDYLVRKVRDLNQRLINEGDARVRNKRFFLGASVSPNRQDWQAELEKVLEWDETVLLKLIPSTQHIQLRDYRHREYYDALAKAKLPLLCHVGPEYTFPEGLRNKELDNFLFLDAPLEHGVTVIAAHCATPVFPLIDKNEIRDFAAFMKSANAGGNVQLWADTSALSLSTRIPFIPEILRSFPPEYLVHGSDFPIPIDGWPHLPLITHDVDMKEYLEIRRAANPLDRDVLIKRAHGFFDTILGNAENVLRSK